MEKKDLQRIEKWSNSPLVYIGYGRTIFMFVLNVWLLVNVADALSSATQLDQIYILGSLIVGSLLGISYPIVLNRYKNNEETEAGSELSRRERSNLTIIKVTIIVIQLFVLFNFLYVLQLQDIANIYSISWGIFNLVVGVMVDFIVGSEFSTYIERKYSVDKPKKESKETKESDKDTTVPVTKSIAFPPKKAS